MSILYTTVYNIFTTFRSPHLTQSDRLVLDVYKIMAYYVRFIWNYRDPLTDKELPYAQKQKLWKKLTAYFKYLLRRRLPALVGHVVDKDVPLVLFDTDDMASFEFFLDFYRQKAKENNKSKLAGD